MALLVGYVMLWVTLKGAWPYLGAIGSNPSITALGVMIGAVCSCWCEASATPSDAEQQAVAEGARKDICRGAIRPDLLATRQQS